MIDRPKLSHEVRLLGWTCWLVLSVLSAAPARALERDPLRARLSVHPGATCVTVEALLPQVRFWLHSDVPRGNVSIEVEGSETDPRHVRFRVIQEGETVAHRTFAPGPAACENLRAALGLTIALALKASVIDDLGRPLPDDPSVRALGWSFTVAIAGAWEILPGIAPGLIARGRLALTQMFMLRLGLMGLSGLGKTLSGSDTGYDAALLALRLDACVHGAPSPSVALHACTGISAGPLYARGHAAVGARTALVPWLALVSGAGVELYLGPRWSLVLEAALFSPLNRIQVGIKAADGQVLAARSLRAFGFDVALGPTYHF